MEKDLGSSKAGENLDAQFFRLPGQPPRQIAQTARIRALVGHERGHQQVRNLGLALAAQHPVTIVGDGNADRCALVLPVGNELVESLGIDYRAGQDVGADLAAFFEDADADLASLRRGELLQADGRGKACRPRADHDDIIFHRFAVAHDTLSCREGQPARPVQHCQFLDRAVNLGPRRNYGWGRNRIGPAAGSRHAPMVAGERRRCAGR